MEALSAKNHARARVPVRLGWDSNSLEIQNQNFLDFYFNNGQLKLTKNKHNLDDYTSTIRHFLPAFQDPITKNYSNLGLKQLKQRYFHLKLGFTLKNWHLVEFTCIWRHSWQIESQERPSPQNQTAEHIAVTFSQIIPRYCQNILA